MTGARVADQPRDPARPWAPTPFGRLARAHALSISGDAMFTAAMAGLVFFNVTNLNQARWQVAAALLFTIVPFSLAAPFIGPLIDRAKGGRKWMVVALAVLRAIVALALAFNRENPFLLYPEFTLVLVFGKGHTLARGALVPATVKSDTELVQANSKLSAISGVAAVAGGAMALVAMWVCSLFGLDQGPSVALFLAAVCYVFCSIEASQLPSVSVAPAPPDAVETAELHGPGIRAAGIAVSVLRVVVGFLTFLLAFHFKDLETTDSWGSKVGLVAAVVTAQLGFLVGSFVAVRARRVVIEEQMVLAALGAIAIAGFLTAFMSELAAAVLLSFAVGLASNAAKQAFDSIVQRDAPDANQGRAFARFETHFQLWWVIGALIPVVVPTVLPISPNLGYFAIAIGCAGGAVWFFTARRRLLAEGRRRPNPFEGEPELVEPRPISRAFLRHRRTTDIPATDVGTATTVSGGYPSPTPSPLDDLADAPAPTDRTMVLPGVGPDGRPLPPPPGADDADRTTVLPEVGGPGAPLPPPPRGVAPPSGSPLPPPPSGVASVAHDPTIIAAPPAEPWPPPGPPPPFDHAQHADDDDDDRRAPPAGALDATVVEHVTQPQAEATLARSLDAAPAGATADGLRPASAEHAGDGPTAMPPAPPRWTGRPDDALDREPPRPSPDDNRWVARPAPARVHDPITDDHDRPEGWPAPPPEASPARPTRRAEDIDDLDDLDDLVGHPYVAARPTDRPAAPASPSPEGPMAPRPRPTSRRRTWAPPTSAPADDDVYGLPSDAAAYLHRPAPTDDEPAGDDLWIDEDPAGWR